MHLLQPQLQTTRPGVRLHRHSTHHQQLPAARCQPPDHASALNSPATWEGLLNQAGQTAVAVCCIASLLLPAIDQPAAFARAGISEQDVTGQAPSPSGRQSNIKADPARVKELLKTLGLHPRTARVLIRTAPEVVDLPDGQLRSRVAAIKSTLKLDDRAFKQAVLQAPRLLTLEPKTLKDHFKRLQKLLGINEAAALQLAITRPAVLIAPPATLQEHLLFIQASLGHSPETAKAVAAANPGLLLLTPATVTGRLEGLEATLGVGGDTAAGLARRAPRLLLARIDSLEDRLKELADTFKVSQDTARDWAVAQPRLLTISPSAALAPTMRLLQETFQVSAEDAALAVRQAPTLLLASRDTARQSWGAAWQAVAGLLQVPLDKAQEVILAEPMLLTMSEAQQGARLEALQDVFRLPLERARELAAQRPMLLVRSRGDLEQIRRQITADMARNIMEKGTLSPQ